MARAKRNLLSQTLTDKASLASDGVTSSQFTELDGHYGDKIIKRIEYNLGFKSGATSDTLEVCDFALVSKPKSEGVPVKADLTDAKYNIKPMRCGASRDSGSGGNYSDYIHFQFDLSVRVPATNNLYMSVHNNVGFTNSFYFLTKLFFLLL